MKQPTQMLQLIASTDSYNLVIPDEVEFKIREWCRLNPTTEWSGTLFYTVEGSFEEKDIEFTVKDFFVMDIGTAGFTNYKETPDICAYMMDNDLLDCKTGLIHSHNNMKAFFSGTDASTLTEEGTTTTHFLSLIVNNEGTYVARVTRKITEVIEGIRHIKYQTYNGEEVSVSEEVKTTGRSYIQYYDLNIKVNNPYNDIKAYISQRYAELKSSKVLNKTTYPQYFDYPRRDTTYTFNSTRYNKEDNEDKKEVEKAPTPVKEVKKERYEPTLFPLYSPDKISDESKEHVAQLIYGNMLLTYESYSKFTRVNEWITTNMEKVFDNRFGCTPADFGTYQDWMYQFCDSIIWDAAHNLIGTDKAIEIDDAAALVASEMLAYLRHLIIKANNKEYLTDCEYNDYLSYILECLEAFINS